MVIIGTTDYTDPDLAESRDGLTKDNSTTKHAKGAKRELLGLAKTESLTADLLGIGKANT